MTKFKALYRIATGLMVALLVFSLALLPVFAAAVVQEKVEATAEVEATTTTDSGVTAETDTTKNNEESSAAATVSSSGSGAFQFTVFPILPDNQRETTQGYFDLTVKPSTTQNLQLMVSNHSDERKIFSVGAVSASTTPSGVVSYVTPGVRDKTLKYPFSEMAKVEEEQFALDARGERVINIVLTTPKEVFDGMVLGGLRVTDITDRLKREQKKKEKEEKTIDEELSMSLYSEYEAVIAVVLHETEKEIAPNFELGHVYFQSNDHRGAIISEIRNTEPLLARKLLFSASIRPDRSDIEIFSINEAMVSFAPSSVMAYAFKDDLGIEPGTYHFVGSLTDGKQVWDFSKTFIVEKEVAGEVDIAARNQQQRAVPPKINPIFIFVIAVLTITVLVLIIILLYRKRRY